MKDLKTINGLEVCRLPRTKFPDVRILAHSVYDADRVAEIFKAGAMGFVSKQSSYEELVLAVREVAKGRRFICSETAGILNNLRQFLSAWRVSCGVKRKYFLEESVKFLICSPGRSPEGRREMSFMAIGESLQII